MFQMIQRKKNRQKKMSRKQKFGKKISTFFPKLFHVSELLEIIDNRPGKSRDLTFFSIKGN